MLRPDDSNLTQQELQTVQKQADLLLLKAAAYGQFPTPIDDLMAAAKLVVVDDELLDEALLHRFLKKAKATLATLKSALTKVLGLFEPGERLVVIDRDIPTPRVPFVKLHEAGHGCLPHQSGMYRLVHDCEKHLDPDTADLFEREANVFAAEALFQGESFARDARDCDFSLKVPMQLADRYGASKYAAFRRYVTTNSRACCLVVLNSKSLERSADGGFAIEVRRVIATKSFEVIFDSQKLFSAISDKHVLGSIVPIGRRMTYSREIRLVDRNDSLRSCRAEAFDTTHHVLILICDQKPASTKILVAARPKVVGKRKWRSNL